MGETISGERFYGRRRKVLRETKSTHTTHTLRCALFDQPNLLAPSHVRILTRTKSRSWKRSQNPSSPRVTRSNQEASILDNVKPVWLTAFSKKWGKRDKLTEGAWLVRPAPHHCFRFRTNPNWKRLPWRTSTSPARRFWKDSKQMKVLNANAEIKRRKMCRYHF